MIRVFTKEYNFVYDVVIVFRFYLISLLCFLSSDASPVKTFDLKTCQRKLAEHYQRTAKVPTTVWTSKFQVDLEQIYTRLSWVKQEQTTAGSSQKELSHCTEIFTEKTKSGVAKRILVQGETGIGKTTFVKKLLVDWSNLEEAKMDEEQKDALRKFDLVVSINLKEVSKCRTFKEVLSQSRVFPDDETSSIDDLLSYIGENQDKVLLVFDGYDEYRTGSEAEKYGSRINSPIFEIFHGNVLRDCTVLVNTRSSRADELQEFADIHLEITGFNWCDQKDFMIKFLGSQTEVDGLLELLLKSKLVDLARVPLLNLFFCLLWKEEKEKLKDGFKSKTELFQAIVKHILQHSYKRHSPSNASQLKEADYNEILTEIGKVALEGLLRGDLLFTFGQLSEKVRGEKSVIVGLVQVSESGPSVEPKAMVSFIHKSIQEYLAAWFVTYRCVPEGNLGGIEQHACTVEDCRALENVFQFVSGLSSQGAVKVFEHFSSVRTRDLVMTIADADNQTDLPLYDLTERHWRFSDLAFNCFREVNARNELLSPFLDCVGEIVPVPTHVLRSQFMPNVKDVSTLTHSHTFAFRFHPIKDWMLQKLLEQFINCFHTPRTTQSAEVHRVGDFLDKFLIRSEQEVAISDELPAAFWELYDRAMDFVCSLHFILRFRSDQFQFYITDVSFNCDDHARLFTETTEICVPAVAANLCSEAESCLKFVRSLRCSSNVSDEAMKCLGGVIRDCKQLRFIKITRGRDSVCDLLEQVPYPGKCSLLLGSVNVHSDQKVFDAGHVCLTSAGAVQLASLLPRFNNISHLSLSFADAEVDALITSITHKSLKRLRLSGMILTPAAAAALGRSLPEMSSLEILDLEAALNQGSLQAVDMDVLFGRFNVTLPLYGFSLSGVSGYLAPLTKSFRFFPNLQQLHLEKLNMNEQNVCDLLEGLRFIPNVRLVSVQGNNVGLAHLSTANANTVTSFIHENLKELTLNRISLNPAAAAALGRSLPRMSSLEKFQLTGIDGNILQAEVIELLFGRFNKTMPLQRLSFGGFIGKGVLALLFNSLHFFSKLKDLHLLEIIKDDQDLSGLLESLRFLPNLETLCVENKRLALADSSVAEVNTVHSVSHRNCRKLTLKGISLTPTISAILGQSLPKMSSLTELKLTGLDGSVVPAEQMERLFDGFTEKLPVKKLYFGGFNVRGCLAPLTRSFSSFPNLMHLSLENLNMDEHDLRGLLESFRFIPNLEVLDLSGNQLGPAVTSIVPHVINLPKLRSLFLCRTGSEKYLNSVRQELRDCGVNVVTTNYPFFFSN